MAMGRILRHALGALIAGTAVVLVPVAKAETVTVGLVGAVSSTHWPIYIGLKKGYYAAEDLQPRIQEQVSAGMRRFVFDLAQLQHIGSVGLRLLVGLHGQLKGNGAVVLCAVSSRVQAILDLTKVRNVLQQYPTPEEALDAVRGR